MKAITIKQPWASLICEGIKDIENRSWRTKFRGRILIHASANSIKYFSALDFFGEERLKVIKEKTGYVPELPISSIIGSVEIIDCVSKTYNRKGDTTSIWADEGQWHWVLANPILFPEPISVKGKQSFWDYPNILAEPEEKKGELFCHCQLPVKEENQVARFITHYRCRYCGGLWYK